MINCAHNSFLLQPLIPDGWTIREDYSSVGRLLRAGVVDFGGHWNMFLPLREFSYNNSYHSNKDMEPFEALYGRLFRSAIVWFESIDVKH